MKAKRARRPGASHTIGISVDAETKATLKRLAATKHGGNVSALVSEMATDAVRRAAFETAWAWYGGPEPTPSTRARLEAEWVEGWQLARKRLAKPSRRRSSA